MVRRLVLLLLLALLSEADQNQAGLAADGVTIHVAPDASGAGDGFAAPASLRRALAIAAGQSNNRVATVIELRTGKYNLEEALQIPSHTTLRGAQGGGTLLSGGVAIAGWAPEPGRPWLFRAALPQKLAGESKLLSQLFVNGQRRGAARSRTMRFASVLVNVSGIQAGPHQLLPRYSNINVMRCLLYQHWTASYRRVVAINTSGCNGDDCDGKVLLDRHPNSLTGDTSSGSRYFLENAPEYLSPGSGTFFADGKTILYAPLSSELQGFSGAAASALAVVGAVPGIFELVTTTNATDVRLENLEFSHTDADFATCFAGTCAFQADTWLTTAALHFEFCQRVAIENVTIQHIGGHGLWFGPGVKSSHFSRGRIIDLGAGAVRIGEALDLTSEQRTAQNVTIADSILRDGGNVFRAGMGVLLQAAANCAVTHNEISFFRQTGISAGWRWDYGPTSCGNNTISFNNISTIGMGETSDLGCVYHLGRDRGTTIHGNLCSNVSAFDYGAMGYYLDQASQFVTVSDNVAHDVKCAGFLQNFGLNCTVSNNVLAFVNENLFQPGADFSGQSCATNTGSAIYAASTAETQDGGWGGACKANQTCYSAFNFSHNIVAWRTGPLLGGGSSLMASTYSSNLYFNFDDVAGHQLLKQGFPCPESFGPVDPATADGVLYDGQSLLINETLLSHGKSAWTSMMAGQLCVGKGTHAGQSVVWCSPNVNKVPNVDRATMQGDGNLCVTSALTPAFCASSCSIHGCPAAPGEFYAQLSNDCRLCVYRGLYPTGLQTWCSPGNCSAGGGVVSPAFERRALQRSAGQGCSFATWQRKGYDHGSAVGDPLFVDAAARDFRLKTGSPALGMGIRSLDVSAVGPRGLKSDDDAATSIIFILSDDLGFGDYLQWHDAPEPPWPGRQARIPTPNIQRMADNGMIFRRSYSGQVCAPSRCMLMLGLHSGHCTIRGNDGSYSPLLPSDITIAAALNRTHTTALFGKWGLGNYGSKGYPLAQGFGSFVGQDSQGSCHDWFPLTIQNGSDNRFVLNTKNETHNGTVCLGPKPMSQCTWVNDHTAAAAQSFIHAQAATARPFFLYLAPTTPHIGHLGSSVGDNGGKYPTPLAYRQQLPQNWSTGSIVKDHTDLQFAAAVIAQDDIVGGMLDAVKATKIERSTCVFFSGDNGPDDHSLVAFDDTGAFRGRKRSLHEGGIRQTLVVQWVGTIQPGSETRHLFAFYDFLPTALDIAGIPSSQWPTTDGVSALPALKGHDTSSSPATSHSFLYWEFCGYSNYSGLLPQLYPVGWAQAVRLENYNTEWKAIRVDRQQQGMLLFNLTSDPSESTPLPLTGYADVAQKIAEIMDREHVESAQWPSNKDPTQVCCGSCFSHHGCSGKGRNCPAPNTTQSADGVNDTSSLPILEARDVHATEFTGGHGGSSAVVTVSSRGSVQMDITNAGAVIPWPGCTDGISRANSTAFMQPSFKLNLFDRSGELCTKGVLASLELRVAKFSVVDHDYAYTTYEMVLRLLARGSDIAWRAPFRGGQRYLSEPGSDTKRSHMQ